MLDLRDNVNLWGPPPAAAAAVSRLDPARLARYPAVGGGRLRVALAEFLGADADELALGCGSDELLDLCFRLVPPGGTVAWPAPTFSMAPRFARASRLRIAALPATAGAPPSAAALLETGAALIYLCSPNNPTGAAVPAGTIAAILGGGGGLVVLDGAYAEFADEPDWLPAARASERLLVLRTFSKAWGLAGLRIGYAVGAPALIRRLDAMRCPYSVNAVAEEAALAALTHDAGWMRARSRDTVASRARLLSELRAAGAAPLASDANFVLVPVACARDSIARLAERRIAVRGFDDLPGIGDAIRVGLGPWPLMQAFLTAFRETHPCG